MKWIEISVRVHPEAVDAVAEVLRQHSSGGVAIEQPVRADAEGEEPPVPEGLPTVTAYLPATATAPTQERRIEQALWHLQAFDLAPVGPIQRRELEDEDWANVWKEHFHPLRIGQVVIKPSWHQWAEAPGDVIVELDPGMAFGTGLHPTTSMTLEALQARVRLGMRVLDLGTGSGILALAAARLGATVEALDVSEVAVEVAERNVAANGLAESIAVREGSIEAVAAQRFELVLANIIARVLIELAPRLADALHPGAELLASGIIEERADDVRQAIREAGLTLVAEQREGDWWLMVARRPA